MSYSELEGYRRKFGYGGVASSNCSGLKIKYDSSNTAWVLSWKDPEDTYIDGQLISSWRTTYLVRKVGSYPTSIVDGTIVCTNKTRNKYATNGYSDDVSSISDPATLYYALIPESDTGAFSINENNQFYYIGHTSEVYEWYKYPSISNPGAQGRANKGRIVYKGANSGYTPAYMNFSWDEFNYGDWEDAFFIKGCRPCMVKYDGTVDYYLNPNDYSLKEDGTASDIANTAYAGNAMVEFPKYYYLYEEITDDDGVACIHKAISNKKINSSYKPWWCFYDKSGNEVDYHYMSIYMGTIISNVMRSISGQTGYNNSTFADELTYANANNTAGGITNQWFGTTAAGWLMICDLLELIGCTTATQETFGYGNYSGNSYTTVMGTLNAKGLFYGSSSASTSASVKVFGMEDFWGKRWNRIVGLINGSGTEKIKLTIGTQDGSTTTGFNATGSGYISLSSSFKPTGTSGGYISATAVNTSLGVELPATASGTSSTYECDGLWFNNSQTNVARVGGAASNGLLCGARALDVSYTASLAAAASGAALSFTPNA